MKKSAFILLLLTGLMLLAPSGCSNGQTEESTESVTSASSAVSSASAESEQESSEKPLILESNVEELSKIEFSAEPSKPYATLKEYISSDSAQSIITEIEKSQSNDLVTTELKVEDDTKLVFLRTLHQDFNPKLYDDFVENVKESVEQQEDIFLSLVDELETGIQRRDITVVVRYQDAEGNVLYERVFDNNKYAEELSEIAESMANQSGQASESE